MNANLSPPRRGFLVSRSEVVERTTSSCDQAPRIDISMGPSLLLLDAPMIGVQKQKLPRVTSPRKSEPNSANWAGLSTSFKEQCTLKSLPHCLSKDGGSDADASSASTALSSETPSSKPPCVRGTRRVSFQRDCHARILGKPMPTRKKELTLYEIKQTWWTRNELRKCRERAQETCREILDSQSDYKLAMVRILKRCGAEPKPEIESYRYYHRILENRDGQSSTNSLMKEEKDILKVIENVDIARGLEKKLLNAMDVPFHRHKRAVHSVIQTQARMRDKECTFAETEQEIATRYRNNCLYAVAWASLIAECDATAAGVRANI